MNNCKILWAVQPLLSYNCMIVNSLMIYSNWNQCKVIYYTNRVLTWHVVNVSMRIITAIRMVSILNWTNRNIYCNIFGIVQILVENIYIQTCFNHCVCWTLYAAMYQLLKPHIWCSHSSYWVVHNCLIQSAAHLIQQQP